MTTLVGMALAIMAILNAKFAKSYLYPPVIYSATWSFLLLGLAVAGETFYPLSFLSLAIFFCGALLFSCGGLVGVAINSMFRRKSNVKKPSNDVFFLDRILKYALIIQVIIAPLYIMRLLKISAFAHTGSFLIGVRIVTSTGYKQAIGFGIYAYVLAAMSFLTMVAFVEIDNTFKRKVRAYLFLFITLIYNILSAARGGAMLLLLTVFVIDIFKWKRISIRKIAILILLFLIIFSISAVLLKKGGNINDSILVNIKNISESIRTYTFASLVAFDINLQNNPSVSANYVFRSVFAVANAFGAKFELPNPVLGYVKTPLLTNLYTIYYSYYGLGVLAFVVIMFLLGIVSTLLYGLAVRGAHYAIVLYCLFASSIFFSGCADPFLATFSYWVQAVAIIMVIYKYPRIKFKLMMPRA